MIIIKRFILINYHNYHKALFVCQVFKHATFSLRSSYNIPEINEGLKKK